MPREEKQQQHLEKLLPESVFKTLIQNGVDINDEKVIGARTLSGSGATRTLPGIGTKQPA
jgi:hypothetical protein